MKSGNEFKVKFEGKTVYGSVSPCSWMHPHYGMQVQLSLKKDAANRESEFLTWDTAYAKSSDADIKKHLSKFFNDGGLAKLVTASTKLKEWEAKHAAERKAELAKIAKKDSLQKKKGHTHKLVAWVHPRSGDDYQIVSYLPTKPTKPFIANLLTKKGSTVVTDYSVKSL